MNRHVSSPHILLIEQDHEVRQECEKLFAQAGWSCEVASSQAWILDEDLAQRHDIIVTDLVMPSKTSVEFLRAMRSRKPTEAIIVTGPISSYTEITNFLREGAVDVIPAPLDLRVLRDSITRISATLSQRTFEHNLYQGVTEASLIMNFCSSDLVDRKVPLQILDQLYLCGRIDLSSRLKMELAFQEALANALDHGNLELDSVWREHFDEQGIDQYSKIKQQRLLDESYAGRRVNIRIELLDATLSIRIKDEGKGFIPQGNSAIDQSDKVGVSCSGRGTAIINGAVEQVSYNAQGNEIRMKMRVSESKGKIDTEEA